MVDSDLVLAKVASVDRCLRRIETVTGADLGRLAEIDIEDIVVLNLQRATQSCIDLAHHLVAALDLGLPATLREAFTLLERGNSLDGQLARRMEAMVGFRNIAVHDYGAINPQILAAIVGEHLGDLRDFCAFAARKIKSESRGS